MTSNINIKLFIKKNIVNKENIFEELNKMKNLMVAKAGTVISEQVSNTDIEAIRNEVSKPPLINSDEQKIVNIVKKYTADKATFQNFLTQYKKTTGKEFGADMFGTILPADDSSEWNDLAKSLAKIGVTLGYQAAGPNSYATFGGLTTPAPAKQVVAPKEGERQNNINATYCGLKGGKIVSRSTLLNGMDWAKYKEEYKVTDEEDKIARNSCQKQKVVGNSGQSGSTVKNRFAKSVSSLGIKNTQMTPETLQSILTTLEGGNPVAKQ